MPKTAECFKVDANNVAESLGKASEFISAEEIDLSLDMTEVRRLDARAVKALEDLASSAEKNRLKVELIGVNVEVYKVLKLMKLDPKFTFLSLSQYLHWLRKLAPWQLTKNALVSLQEMRCSCISSAKECR